METPKSLLGIDLPLIQAPMAGYQSSAMAIAVCNAGALGSLPCATLDMPTLRREITEIKSQTDRPYNVNFFCHTPPPVDLAREARWRTTLSNYYAEYDIDPVKIPTGPGRFPFNAESIEVLNDFRPPIVSFHFGLPAPELLAPLRAWGTRILSSATTVEEALWLEAHGVDAIIAQGLEAGGHRGHFLSDDLTVQMTTLSLVPQIIRKVRVPVIASGGIVDRRGVTAAMSLGSAAVQIGTAFLLCPEASTSAVHRSALKSDAGRHTAVTNIFTGKPARGIVNRFMRERGPMSDATPAFPLAVSSIAPLRAAAEAKGSGDFTSLWSGQNATGCKEVPAASLVRELIE